MIICAVLLVAGGVVSWLTIRNQVLEAEIRRPEVDGPVAAD